MSSSEEDSILDAPPGSPAESPVNSDLAILTVDGLRKLASAMKLPIAHLKKRADLVNGIRAAASSTTAPNVSTAATASSDICSPAASTGSHCEWAQCCSHTCNFSGSDSHDLFALMSQMAEEMAAMKKILAEHTTLQDQVISLRTEVRDLRTAVRDAHTLPRPSTEMRTHPTTYATAAAALPATTPQMQKPEAPQQQTLSRSPNKRNEKSRQKAPQNRRKESSRFVRPSTPKADDHSEKPAPLSGALRPRLKVFYVGDIEPSCDAASIADWCKERTVEVVQCVVYSSDYFRTAYARVTVLEQDVAKLQGSSFWPDRISHTVREWRFQGDQPNPSS